MRVFISNGEVAWEIPPPIGDLFYNGYYICLEGWHILLRADLARKGQWVQGELGEWRLQDYTVEGPI